MCEKDQKDRLFPNRVFYGIHKFLNEIIKFFSLTPFQAYIKSFKFSKINFLNLNFSDVVSNYNFDISYIIVSLLGITIWNLEKNEEIVTYSVLTLVISI